MQHGPEFRQVQARQPINGLNRDEGFDMVMSSRRLRPGCRLLTPLGANQNLTAQS